jgi:hypothetical protein
MSGNWKILLSFPQSITVIYRTFPACIRMGHILYFRPIQALYRCTCKFQSLRVLYPEKGPFLRVMATSSGFESSNFSNFHVWKGFSLGPDWEEWEPFISIWKNIINKNIWILKGHILVIWIWSLWT